MIVNEVHVIKSISAQMKSSPNIVSDQVVDDNVSNWILNVDSAWSPESSTICNFALEGNRNTSSCSTNCVDFSTLPLDAFSHCVDCCWYGGCRCRKTDGG